MAKRPKNKRKKPVPKQLAGRTFTVRVTRKDIREGQPDDPNYCPIALALQRATGVEDVEVESSSIRVDGFKELTTPRHIEDFVEDFDGGGNVKPFRFRITIPVEGGIEIL